MIFRMSQTFLSSILMIIFWQNILHIQASSTSVSESSSSPYTSIGSLDKYGNSIQIRNARLSSLKHGTPIIAAISTGSSGGSSVEADKIIVCSLEPPRFKQLGRVSSTTEMVDFLTPLPDDEKNCRIVAMVASGLQADRRFIVSSLRRYSMRVWERFDVVPNCDRMALACSQVFLAFMGYDVQDEAGDGVKEVMQSNDEKDRFQMSRPFGISALFLGLSRKGKKIVAEIKSVEPSGVILESVAARAMGKESEQANKLLKQRWKRGMSAQQVQDMCVAVLEEIIFDKSNSGSNDSQRVIICEVIDNKGKHNIKRVSIPLNKIDMLPNLSNGV